MMLSSFLLLQGSHTWQDTPFQEFKRGTATCRDVGHLISCPCLLNRCCRITTTNDRGCASSGTLGQCLYNRIGPLSKGRPFCYSQRAIKNNGLCVCQGFPESINGFGANVHNTPTGFNLVDINDLGIRIRSKAISNDYITG